MRAGALRILLVAGLVTVAGCRSTEMLPIAPIPLPDPVRVTIDGEVVTLHHPYLEEGDLVGWERPTRSDSTLVRVPYEQEMVRLDRDRSLLAGVGAAILLIVLIAAL